MVAGKEASGEVLPYAGLPGRIVAPNLTPDPETGAGSWTDDQLARAIREGVGHDGRFRVSNKKAAMLGGFEVRQDVLL